MAAGCGGGSNGPPALMLTALSPNSTPGNTGGVNITITGIGFTPATVIYFGNSTLPATYVSSTQIKIGPITFLQTTAGTFAVSARDPASPNGTSNSLTFTVTAPLPIASTLAPSSMIADQGAQMLTVTGQYFTATSVVQLNGSDRPTKLTGPGLLAQLSAADIANAGNVSITVTDPASGNVASNALTLTITPLPALALTALSPKTVAAGNGAFTLTVLGTGFVPASAIAWNATALPTIEVSPTALRATVSAAQVAAIASVPITVVNPANLGGSSGPLTLKVLAPSIDAVSYQIDTAHTGVINFQAVSLPSAAAWTIDLGGAPSNALIVAGRVYVMATANNASQLFALDLATGQTVWGPLAFAGAAGVTYDSGMLFVNSGTWYSNGILSALDVTTGAPIWSSVIQGTFATQSPAVAAQGTVYILEDGLVTAYDETNGAQLWLANVTGTNGSVAVTVDGVYASAPCTATSLQPTSGAVIWSNNTGCVGGGGATPVVAAGRFYAPIGGWYTGNVYATDTGNVLGAFTAGAPPAVSATAAYVLNNLTLQRIALNNSQIGWSFAGDGTLVTSPLVVNNYVFIGSVSGNLYALDATSGSQLWVKNLGAALAQPQTGGNAAQGQSGLAAGDGVLIVPAGNSITAFVLSTTP